MTESCWDIFAVVCLKIFGKKSSRSPKNQQQQLITVQLSFFCEDFLGPQRLKDLWSPSQQWKSRGFCNQRCLRSLQRCYKGLAMPSKPKQVILFHHEKRLVNGCWLAMKVDQICCFSCFWDTRIAMFIQGVSPCLLGFRRSNHMSFGRSQNFRALTPSNITCSR